MLAKAARRALDAASGTLTVVGLAMVVALRYGDPATYAVYCRAILPMLICGMMAWLMYPLYKRWLGGVTMTVCGLFVYAAPVLAHTLTRYGLWPTMDQRGWWRLYLAATVLLVVGMVISVLSRWDEWDDTIQYARRVLRWPRERRAMVAAIASAADVEPLPPLWLMAANDRTPESDNSCNSGAVDIGRGFFLE